MVIAIDGERIDSADRAVLAIRSHRIGETVTVVVMRGEERLEFEVVLGSDEKLQELQLQQREQQQREQEQQNDFWNNEGEGMPDGDISYEDIFNKAITAERTFTAGAAQGTVEMKFHFDSSLLKGKTVVVFEDLYILKEDGKRIKIASHADVNDAAQSVKITAPEVTKAPKKAVTPGPAGSAGTANGVTAAKTGDTSHMLLYVLILAGAVLAGAGLIMVKKKGRPDREKV